MKRYLLFAGDDYYASGGWSDFVKSFDDKDEAFAAGRAMQGTADWWQVVDLETEESLRDDQQEPPHAE